MAATSSGPSRGYSVASFATRKPNIEEQIREALFTPSPQTYNPVKVSLPTTTAGGLISGSKVPSPLDQPKKLSGYVPGPGSYNPSGKTGEYALPEGGKISKPAPERLKVDEYPKPGPGRYGVPSTTQSHPRSLQGRFSKEPKVSEFIRKEERRTRHIPGPGAHEVLESMEYVKPLCPEGGRWNSASKPLGYFEQAPRLVQDHPEPGSYNLPGDMQTKEVGRLVYKYQSATMQESKDLVRRTVGGNHETPGPGAYDIPDPPPLAGAPELRGRERGPPLPPPFAYNCTTNYTRSHASFSSLAPVRQQNNAELIWGNGVRRRTPGQSRNSPTNAGSARQADELPERPSGVGGPLDEEKEGAVQWRFGGFSSIKKSKSVSVIREHPSVEAAQKHYESLSRQFERNGKTFLPMASKRCDSISVGGNSSEYQKIVQGKWQLAAVAESIKTATNDALEPLDEEKLKSEAMAALRDKARERMRLEGVAKEQQDAVLTEMLGVLEEHSQASLSSRVKDSVGPPEVNAGEAEEGEEGSAS